MKLNDMNLPIQDHARAILQMVRSSQVCIVEGAPGSGKTTLLPYLMYRGGFARHGKIACVLPTRPGAILASEFVGELLQDKGADIVGHRVRDSVTDWRETKIVYMTEGVLANSIRTSAHLDRYTVIILDEVHERKMNYDFLLGYLKSLLPLRPDLKLLLSSATMQTDELSAFFGGVPSYSIPGRMFPVELKYRAPDPTNKDSHLIFREIGSVVREIYTSTAEAGHCLVFLPGAAEIFFAQRFINALNLPNVECMPFHGRLEREDRKRVFSETSARKIILATNIAETSITIKGIAYVIDTGLAREAGHVPSTNIRSLHLGTISQSSAIQRGGRAGRTGPGVCYRMYSEASFNARPEYSNPGIKREDIVDLVFLLMDLGVKYPDQLDLPTRITQEQSECAVRRLQQWGIISDERYLTPFGEKLVWIGAGFGVQVGRMLLLAAEAGVGTEAAEVAAYLAIGKFNDREGGISFRVGGKYQQFADPRGDPITFIRMLRAYGDHRGDATWCRYQGLDIRLLEDAFTMRDTLVENLESLGYHCSGAHQDLDKVHRAFVKAWGGTLCVYERNKQYRCTAASGIRYAPPDHKESGYPPYVIAFGLMQREGRVHMINAVTVPEDMMEEILNHYPDPSIAAPTKDDGRTLRVSGMLRISTALAERIVRVDVNCARSPKRSLRVVSGNTVVVEENRVPLSWLRISEAVQIELARHSIMTLADCPKTFKGLYNCGLPESVCQEVLDALSRYGYVPTHSKTIVETVADQAQQEDVQVANAEVIETQEPDGDWLVNGMLKQSVTTLGLRTTTVLHLMNGGIQTIQDLADLPGEKLRNICGRKDSVADEVLVRLEEYGIELDSGAEQRQMQRQLHGELEPSDMKELVTEDDARRILGDVDYDRFVRYRTADNPFDRIGVRNELLCEHQMLTGKMAYSLQNILARANDKAISADDLMQEGIFGLMTAIALFVPRSGFRFSTYACQWIRQAMVRMIANQGVIRFPVHLKDELGKYRSTFMALTAKFGRDPTDYEISSRLNTSMEHVRFLQELHFMSSINSLDAPFDPALWKNGSKNGEWGRGALVEYIPSKIPTPEDAIMRLHSDARMKHTLTEVLDDLHVPARHMVMYRMRHGLDGDEPMTLERVAEAFGVTRERIRQIEEKVDTALNRPDLKARLLAATPWGYRFNDVVDDQSRTIAIDEERSFELRPEVAEMRVKGAAIMQELRAALASLPVPTLAIKAFKLHHGLYGEAEMPLAAVAVRLKVTMQLVQQGYDLVIKHLNSKSVWQRMRRLMPSLPEPRQVIEPLAEIQKTGSADSIALFVAPQPHAVALAKEIIETVALRAQIDPDRLLKPSRKAEVVQTRWLAMVILRDHLNLSFSEIGRQFGGMDRTTVMHGYKQGKRLFGHVEWKHENTKEVARP